MSYMKRSFTGIGTRHINETLTLIAASIQVDNNVPMPCYLGAASELGTMRTYSKRRYTAVENGLVDVDAIVRGDGDTLRPHSPRWFSTTCLPFEFDADATCPIWEGIITTNLNNDPELIQIVQEFFGLCLVFDTDFQVFLFLFGNGGTGKSATLGALEALLGSENVSNVPLERVGKDFALIGMYGKLANVVSEIGETDKVAESTLKSLVSGDMMEFQRKNLTSIFAQSTARMVFASNVLPKFRDKTDGLWRRMLIVPFNREVLESEKIRGLDKPEGWSDLGELSGMLNWSIDGLRRLRENGRFTISEASENLKSQYRKNCNPVQQFMEEYVEDDASAWISKNELYDAYSEFCGRSGYRPIPISDFNREVPKHFPHVAGGDRKRIDGKRQYVWKGFRLT